VNNFKYGLEFSFSVTGNNKHNRYKDQSVNAA